MTRFIPLMALEEAMMEPMPWVVAVSSTQEEAMKRFCLLAQIRIDAF
jgi:hypothetical protein